MLDLDRGGLTQMPHLPEVPCTAGWGYGGRTIQVGTRTHKLGVGDVGALRRGGVGAMVGGIGRRVGGVGMDLEL